MKDPKDDIDEERRMYMGDKQFNIRIEGDVKNAQIQQGIITDSSQVQTNEESLDFDLVNQILKSILAYSESFSMIYGNQSQEVILLLDEGISLTEQKKQPSKINQIISKLKSITANVVCSVSTSLVVSGIMSLLEKISL